MLFRQRFASFLSLWHSWLYVYRTPILLSVSYLAWKKMLQCIETRDFWEIWSNCQLWRSEKKGSLWTVLLCTNRTHMWFHRAHFMGKIFIWSLNSVPFCHIPVNESIRRLFRKGVKSAKKKCWLAISGEVSKDGLSITEMRGGEKSQKAWLLVTQSLLAKKLLKTLVNISNMDVYYKGHPTPP